MATDRKSMADTRRSLADPDYKGEDYAIDPELERGPLKDRRCTDILCLLIFFCTLGFAGYVFVYALEEGDPQRVMAPYDSDGKFCGIDDGYEDYPYLFYTDVNPVLWAPYSVCVKTCPMKEDEGYPYFECKATENVSAND